VAHRAGTAQAGFKVLSSLAFVLGGRPPAGTPVEYAAVRHALAVWQVNTVVVATNPAVPPIQQGHDPTYVAAFMTAALGYLPTIQAGAWVWDDVDLRRHGPMRPAVGTLSACQREAEGPSGRVVAAIGVADCVALSALGTP
jgi:hypothetical protein